MLELKTIDSFYGASQILHGVTTNIADGVITAVLGRNGIDETTEGIEPNLVEEIQNIIIGMKREGGLTIILVEQKGAFATRAANNFLMMEKGRFVASGSIGKLTQDVIHRHLAV